MINPTNNPKSKWPRLTRAPLGSIKFQGFSGSLSWTVESADYNRYYVPGGLSGLYYAVLGHFLLFTIYVDNTTISGSGNTLLMTLPQGLVAKRMINGQCFISPGGVWATGKVRTSTAGIHIYQADEGNLAAATNTFHVNMGGLVEITKPVPNIF